MNVIIIQARLGSSRFEKKIFKKIGEKKLLDIVYERVKKSLLADKVVFAITDEKIDDELEQYLKSKNYNYFRGSENNVLERFYLTAKAYRAKNIIRVTCDDPLKDSDIIDKSIRILTESNLDYVSNTIEPTYPEGLDIEVMTFTCLAKAYKEAILLSDKEHVTPYIWKNNSKFKLLNFKADNNYSHYRWTFDNKNDYKFFNEIYNKLGCLSSVNINQVFKLIEKYPELSKINNNTIRNEGYKNSLKRD